MDAGAAAFTVNGRAWRAFDLNGNCFQLYLPPPLSKWPLSDGLSVVGPNCTPLPLALIYARFSTVLTIALALIYVSNKEQVWIFGK